jgi:hypothetical protein
MAVLIELWVVENHVLKGISMLNFQLGDSHREPITAMQMRYL